MRLGLNQYAAKTILEALAKTRNPDFVRKLGDRKIPDIDKIIANFARTREALAQWMACSARNTHPASQFENFVHSWCVLAFAYLLISQANDELCYEEQHAQEALRLELPMSR